MLEYNNTAKKISTGINKYQKCYKQRFYYIVLGFLGYTQWGEGRLQISSLG